MRPAWSLLGQARFAAFNVTEVHVVFDAARDGEQVFLLILLCSNSVIGPFMATPTQYQVSRNGQVIGSFDEGEMIAKVATGQVMLTDFYWTAGMSAWAQVNGREEWVRHAPKAAPLNQVAPPMPSGPASPVTASRPARSYPAGTLVCTQCGCTGTESHTKGSFLIEVILWLFFCIPGVIYSIWRLTTRGQVCSSCKSDRLVSANSPAGQNLLSRS